MYFYLVPPIYVFGHILFFLILNWWLSSAFASWQSSRTPKVILAAVILVFMVIGLLGCFLPDSSLKFRLTAAANIWFGVIFYMGLTALTASIILLAVRLILHRDLLSHVWLARALSVLIVLETAAVNIYGLKHATDVKVNTLSVHVDKPFSIGEREEKRNSLKVVLIGDLHMSVNSTPEHIRKTVELINQQDADLVLAAGDFLTSTYNGLKDPETYQEILKGIKSRYGSYAVYGNHDVEEPLLGGFPMTGKEKAIRSDEIPAFIAGCGFEILSDEVREIVENKIVLVCREDGEKTGRGLEERMKAQDLMAGIDRTKPVLVLEHEPVDYANLYEAGADAVFSGHTHAGQMFPATLFTPLFNENNYGLKLVDGVQSVVTSGVGFYGPPLRVGSDSEVMVVDLTFEISE